MKDRSRIEKHDPVMERSAEKWEQGLTIEAQPGLPEAIHEMLLRTEDGVLRIFKDAPPVTGGCRTNQC